MLERYKRLKSVEFSVFNGEKVSKFATCVFIEGVSEDGKKVIEKENIETLERKDIELILSKMGDWDGIN